MVQNGGAGNWKQREERRVESLMENHEAIQLARRAKCMGGLAICLFVLLACPDVQEMVPPQLRGTWITESELYEGRLMKIERHQITFDSGAGEVATYQILGVFTERLEEETRYALDYVMESGGEYRLHLIFEVASGQMRLAHRRQVIWTREVS